MRRLASASVLPLLRAIEREVISLDAKKSSLNQVSDNHLRKAENSRYSVIGTLRLPLGIYWNTKSSACDFSIPALLRSSSSSVYLCFA